MDELNKVERPHSSSGGEVECFSSRLTEIIGSDSARSFAMKADLSQTAIQKYLIGDSTPNVERLIAIAKAGGVTVEWLVTGNGPKYQKDFDAFVSQSHTDKSVDVVAQMATPSGFLSEFALIPGYSVQVSAGWGSEGSDEVEPSRHLAFRKRWLKWRGFAEKDLVVVWAKGDSMEPIISNNNTLLINMQRTELTDGNIFVIRNENQLWVKRVQVMPNAWLLLSDNPLYKAIEVPMDEQHSFQVVGQVVHISKDIGD
ncbi:XRE family transcriptional regulator [Shewanella oncorhynchi]|uniref:XRE family transcriptional regulator n=1 Tax=Shewanella oncorhynchi TaxID=2726434 RepID=UPI003D7B1EE9